MMRLKDDMRTFVILKDDEAPPVKKQKEPNMDISIDSLLTSLGETIANAMASATGKDEQRFVDAVEELTKAGCDISLTEELINQMTAKPVVRKSFDEAVQAVVDTIGDTKVSDRLMGRLADSVAGLKKLATKQPVAKAQRNWGAGFSSSPAIHGPFDAPAGGVSVTLRCDANMLPERMTVGPANGSDSIRYLQSLIDVLRKAETNKVGLGELSASWSLSVEVEAERTRVNKGSDEGESVGSAIMRGARRTFQHGEHNLVNKVVVKQSLDRAKE